MQVKVKILYIIDVYYFHRKSFNTFLIKI